MSKSNFLKNLIFLSALVCLWIFPHLFLSSEIRLLKREEQNLQSKLKVINDKIERIIAQELRTLQSEERIVRLGIDSLGLVRALKPFDEIVIDANRIKQIEKIVNRNYD
ncbi:MAG TPA: hypothetical protein ENN33_15045 [Ignavibacteria bacterium]|nr:hypothetical protein [Ignavibacteria bacterium]